VLREYREYERAMTTLVDAAVKPNVSRYQGPGLRGSLLVGTSYAKGLSMALGKPLIAVDHMQAHILAHFIDKPGPSFPFLCLTVSGGHTQIVRVDGAQEMQVLGKTIDDAAGEAFDKTGKMLGLPYPAGPVIDRLAGEGEAKYTFPEPRVAELDFSFSGLKTSIKYFLRDQQKVDPGFVEREMAHVCASVQQTIVKILLDKLAIASEMTGIREIAIAGGVSANSGLRNGLQERAASYGWTTYIPKFAYCTDNAAMIAITAHYKYLTNDFAELSVSPEVRLKFST
jgi:N6-L-threonylcarbamoyladenine synthase